MSTKIGTESRKLKILVQDEYDGFCLIGYSDGQFVNRIRIDQEDTREILVEFFKSLGIDSEHEVIC